MQEINRDLQVSRYQNSEKDISKENQRETFSFSSMFPTFKICNNSIENWVSLDLEPTYKQINTGENIELTPRHLSFYLMGVNV